MNYGIFKDANIYEADGYSLKENVSLSDYLKHCKNWGESGQGWKYEDKLSDAIDSARDFAEGSKVGVSVVCMDTYKTLETFEAGIKEGARDKFFSLCNKNQLALLNKYLKENFDTSTEGLTATEYLKDFEYALHFFDYINEGDTNDAKSIEESIYLMCEELAGKEDFENNTLSVHFQETEDFKEYYRVYAKCGYIVDVSCEVIEKDGKEEKRFFVLDFHGEDEHSIGVDKNELHKLLISN